MVRPVSSPTDLLQQVVYFCGRIVGSSSMTAYSEAGMATDITFASISDCPPCPNPGNASCNMATVPLLPGQMNHVTVCQQNGSCPAGGCVTVDVNGSPLDIAQNATATATPTLTFTQTPTDTPMPTFTPTLTPIPPPPCCGDCNLDGRVTIDELIRAVNNALGNSQTGMCYR